MGAIIAHGCDKTRPFRMGDRSVGPRVRNLVGGTIRPREGELTLRRLRLTALAALIAVTAAACSPSVTWRDKDQARSSSDAGSTSLTWRNCDTEARQINRGLSRALRFDCATLRVPRDWKTIPTGTGAAKPTMTPTPIVALPPGTPTFDIALMRARSTRQAHRQGSIVVDPGGPGGSGVEFLAYVAPQFGGLLDTFDIVGLDPRGVGRSSPVECVSDTDLDATFAAEFDPHNDDEFQTIVDLAKKIAADCSAAYGVDLDLFSTEQAARDLDAIRVALGEEKLNYLGYSYGTLLGAVYAHLFGSRVRAMVLDGAVDPSQSPVQSSEGQAMGLERAFANFTAWCRATHNRCPIARDPRAEVVAALDSARTAPVRGADGREATEGIVMTAVIASLYTEQTWRTLAEGVQELRQGKSTKVFSLADGYAERDKSGHYSNLFDANMAINCADSDQYPTPSQVRALAQRWRTAYPLFGSTLAVGLLNCAVWSPERDPYPVGPATGAPTIMVVGTTGDPATPYESTQKLATLLGTGIVVTWHGEGHTAYPGSPCIVRAVEDYFTKLTAPKAGIDCPA